MSPMSSAVPGGVNVASPAPEAPFTLKELEKHHDHVGANNEKIAISLGRIVDLANILHGEGPPSGEKPDDDRPAGALGHITFSLTEQDRLLAALSEAISRL